MNYSNMVTEIKYNRIYNKLDAIINSCNSTNGGIIRYYTITTNDEYYNMFNTYKGKLNHLDYENFKRCGLSEEITKDEVEKYINDKLWKS